MAESFITYAPGPGLGLTVGLSGSVWLAPGRRHALSLEPMVPAYVPLPTLRRIVVYGFRNKEVSALTALSLSSHLFISCLPSPVVESIEYEPGPGFVLWVPL
jgi:hypothetical protein